MGTPPPAEVESKTVESSSSPEHPPAFGCKRKAPLDVKLVAPSRGEQALQIQGDGGYWLACPPQLPQLDPSSALGTQPGQAPGK